MNRNPAAMDRYNIVLAVGWFNWLPQVREKYVCPECGTMKSAYDQVCRKCGQAPSCNFVLRHREEIADFCKRTGQ